MKSPISSVGIIEPDGILNGSTRNERSRNTTRITGKKLIEYSTHQGCFASSFLDFRKKSLSSSQTTPVIASNRKRKRAKLTTFSSLVARLQDCEERFLRYFHRADLLHALFPFLLFIQQLALARGIAAVALGDHVLAQRLDVFARDD